MDPSYDRPGMEVILGNPGILGQWAIRRTHEEAVRAHRTSEERTTIMGNVNPMREMQACETSEGESSPDHCTCRELFQEMGIN